jgi:hypothetical protein
MRSRVLPWLALALLSATSSCASQPRRQPDQSVEVRVTDFAGAPIEGASLAVGAREIASTAADGVATVTLTGRDGDLVALDVRCPAGYAAPAEPVLVRWLSVDGGTASHAARCRKLRHRLVVLVRADGGPNLPILRLGRVVGTTDAAGAASMMFDLDRDERVELTLSTASLEKERVTPRDPTAVLEVTDADDVRLFDVKLARPKPAAKRGFARRSGPVPM